MADQILNVVLHDNPLTPDPSDRVGTVKLNGTWYNTTIARKIVEQRSELRYETILSVLNVADELKRTAIATGNSVVDGVSHMRPSVPGAFKGDAAQYDPEVNRKTVIMSPTLEMHRALEASKVVVLGPAQTGPVINRVEDLYSGKVNSELTPGRNLRIYGQRLRIAGEDPDVIGVWFVAVGEGGLRFRVNDRDLIDNLPSHLTVIIPSLAVGEYFLEVTTQSIGSKSELSKTPRTFRFEIILTIPEVPIPGNEH
ncbi:MAG: DUF4469 domain-containing protein [Tannerella sp.]|jgi:hypothetical protein|nr:DUF4469 domain-containing protein [Tannerella sp.]